MSSDSVPPPSGTVVGESIPTPLLVGMAGGLIYSIIIMICHLSITKCLLNSRLKQIPRARKVKVKKTKKGKKEKKGKKGKKGKKKRVDETTSSDGTTTGSKTGTMAM